MHCFALIDSTIAEDTPLLDNEQGKDLSRQIRPWMKDLATLYPHFKQLSTKDAYLVVIPHNTEYDPTTQIKNKAPGILGVIKYENSTNKSKEFTRRWNDIYNEWIYDGKNIIMPKQNLCLCPALEKICLCVDQLTCIACNTNKISLAMIVAAGVV